MARECRTDHVQVLQERGTENYIDHSLFSNLSYYSPRVNGMLLAIEHSGTLKNMQFGGKAVDTTTKLAEELTKTAKSLWSRITPYLVRPQYDLHLRITLLHDNLYPTWRSW